MNNCLVNKSTIYKFVRIHWKQETHTKRQPFIITNCFICKLNEIALLYLKALFNWQYVLKQTEHRYIVLDSDLLRLLLTDTFYNQTDPCIIRLFDKKTSGLVAQYLKKCNGKQINKHYVSTNDLKRTRITTTTTTTSTTTTTTTTTSTTTTMRVNIPKSSEDTLASNHVSVNKISSNAISNIGEEKKSIKSLKPEAVVKRLKMEIIKKINTYISHQLENLIIDTVEYLQTSVKKLTISGEYLETIFNIKQKPIHSDPFDISVLFPPNISEEDKTKLENFSIVYKQNFT